MDPYKFNSWIRLLISLCSTGAYILISLMLPLFVAVPSFETTYGIFFVSPYNDSKYIKWHEFESHACKNENVALPQINYNASKGKEFTRNMRKQLCHSINFLKNYLLITFIVSIIDLIVVKGVLLYAHFREHPETFALKHVKFCNKLITLIICITITNCILLVAPVFFFNSYEEFGKTHYLHAGFYILLADFLTHFIIVIFLKRDKTILKYVCELELIPWDEKRKLPVHYAEFNDTLISPNEITNYLQGLFQQDNINEEQLKNFFGTDNYEQIYYVILNNLKNQKQMMNITPM
ncbi:hypothetical protein CYL21_1153 [Plasmodium falciparum NF54]|uniref:Uncharacterized protein n=2 Tax=Plasmodium falciparum TaxID=5833 RepID=Q8I2Y9_PLAF7|nr:conserved Plasmodium protein, unknown function [Plasmodium falciparum 3D7]KAF4330777.1 hypothetical protein CYL21_1153 [Plasmodium falciparum NF54]PKC45007.1 hypothetical protein CK202_3997 [Plasmodium falciparum NF54]CAD51846.2 conserved Plasmodium protein, unknown function [Plasmodium falciparum 3D7]|eukprot:XP_024328911.1 conserved Plasmodium protein, unknown function [Plasmodium falciparum 3D7]